MKDVNIERKKQILGRAKEAKNAKVVRYVFDSLFDKLDEAGESAGVWLEQVEKDFEVLTSRPQGLLRRFDDSDFRDLFVAMFGYEPKS